MIFVNRMHLSVISQSLVPRRIGGGLSLCGFIQSNYVFQNKLYPIKKSETEKDLVGTQIYP